MILHLLPLLASASIISAGGALERLGPPPGMEREGEIAVYPAERLWDYIDGAADIYLDYGVEETAAVSFKRPASELPEVVIDLHQMADTKGSFGIFANDRAGGGEGVGLGAASLWTPGFLAFRKGRYYARIVTEISKDSTLALARRLDDLLPAEADSFPALDLFPADGRIRSKDSYVARRFLGIRTLDDIWSAAYADSAGEYRLLLRGNRIPLREGDVQGIGKIVSVPTDERPVQMIELAGDRTLILFYIRKCRYLSGYYGAKPGPEMTARIARWVDSLPKVR